MGFFNRILYFPPYSFTLLFPYILFHPRVLPPCSDHLKIQFHCTFRSRPFVFSPLAPIILHRRHSFLTHFTLPICIYVYIYIISPPPPKSRQRLKWRHQKRAESLQRRKANSKSGVSKPTLEQSSVDRIPKNDEKKAHRERQT